MPQNCVALTIFTVTTDDPDMFPNATQDQSAKPTCKSTMNQQSQVDERLRLEDDNTPIKPVSHELATVYRQTLRESGRCAGDLKKSRKSMLERISTILSHVYQDPSTIKNGSTMTLVPTVSESIGSRMSTYAYRNNARLSKCQSCLRTLVAMLISCFLGLLTVAILLYVYAFPVIWAYTIAAILTLVMNVALIISPHSRCVTTLMTVSVFTGQGRAAFLSLIPGLVLAGPILNMQRNTNDGVNSIGCLAGLVFNQAAHLHEQFLDSVTRQREDLVDLASEAEKNITLLTNKLRPTAKVTEASIFPGNGNRVCEQELQRLLRTECREAALRLPVSDVLPTSGQPIPKSSCSKICDTLTPEVLCAHLQGYQFPCRSPTRKKRSLLTNFGQDLEDLLSFRVNSSRVIDLRSNASFSPILRIRKVQEDIQRKVDQVVFVVAIINKFLLLFLILAFVNSCLYLRAYMKNIKHDNVYITSQLKVLNSRRSLHTETLFPLQGREKKKYIDATSIKLTKPEAGAWMFGFAQVVLHFVISGLFVLMDYGIYGLLSFVTANGAGEIILSGGALVDIDVDGTGLVSQIFRAIVASFNGSSTFENVLDFGQCLPNPSEPSGRIAFVILALYAVTTACVLLQAYGLRLRCKIAAFFFPIREEERVSFLYQRILNKRRFQTDVEKNGIKISKF